MLRAVLKNNKKMWEECLPHIEFAYNRSLHPTTKMCPFEVVYDFLPRAPIDLLPLPSLEKGNFDAKQHTSGKMASHNYRWWRAIYYRRLHYFFPNSVVVGEISTRTLHD